MVAALDAAPRATTVARGPAPTTMEETAPARMATLDAPQASPTLLQATPPAVAAANPHAVALAWGRRFSRPSPRPGEAREGVRLSPGGIPGLLGWLERGEPRRVRPFFSFCFLRKREQLHGAPWG